MNTNKVYECPKCHNKLPYSNKMLHDLKCTKNNPAQFSVQNPIASYNYEYSTNDSIDFNNYSNGFNFYNPTQRNSTSSQLSSRMSITNNDGTTTEIKKDTNMSGKEELLEITYDPQGNIIGRKKADGGSSNVKYKFRDMLEYKDTEVPENYYIYEGSNVYVETAPNEFNYEITTQNNYNYGNEIINNQNFQHNFGTRGYSLMQSKINNAYIVNLDNNNNVNNNTINNDANNNIFNSLEEINFKSDYNKNYNYNHDQNNSNNQLEQNSSYNVLEQTLSINPFELNQNNMNRKNIKLAKVTKLN